MSTRCLVAAVVALLFIGFDAGMLVEHRWASESVNQITPQFNWAQDTDGKVIVGCSLGQKGWPAREDGQCYLVDAPK